MKMLEKPKISNLLHAWINRLSNIGKKGTRLNNFLKIIVRKTPAGLSSKFLYWVFLIILHIRDFLSQKPSFSNIASIIKDLKYRWLSLPKDLKKMLKGKNIIWINAIGVGEWNLVEPLLKYLKEKYPDYVTLLSCSNKQVFKYAQLKFSKVSNTYIIYTPFNIPKTVNRFLNIFRVKLFIMTETPGQIGANFLNALQKNNGISVLFNGLSIKKQTGGLIDIIRKKGYGEKTGTEIFNDSNIDYLLMKDAIEAKKIKAQGANESQIHVFGNVKYDASVCTISSNEKEKLYQILKVKKNTPIILAGSTHLKEHEIILDVYQELKKKYPTLLLIIAPRNLVEVKLILNKINPKFICFCKTKLEDQINILTIPDIVVLDTLGELKKFYSIATIAIVCGSFFPCYHGHNILEPASFAKPIIFGPYMRDFVSIAELFVKEKGALQVNNKVKLIQVVIQLLANKNLRQKYGENAYNLLKKNCGTLKHALTILDNILMKTTVM